MKNEMSKELKGKQFLDIRISHMDADERIEKL